MQVTNMEQIIANLLVADNELIQKATEELQEAYKRPETVPALCDLVVSGKESQIRQYAAVLLKKRLGKLRNWQLVPPDQQEIIKRGMLNALIQERERPVRLAIAQFVGVLIKHEADKKDAWISEILKFIYSTCSSSDPQQSELGSSIFAVLTDVAPDQFLPHMGSICEMFTAALSATEASGNMATPVIYNIIQGMAFLTPFILGHNTAEHTYQKSIPLIIKSLQAFAVQDEDKFIKAFDILENMADYAPKLLNSNIKQLIDFCLEAANNIQLDSSIRVKAVAYIGWLVRLKKKVLIKLKLIEPIIQVVFNLMTAAPENEDVDDEEYFLGEDRSNPMTTATQTMDLLALHVPPEKLIPPLLQYLDVALRSNEALQKKAAYLCMAVIAEGCSEAICNKYLPPLLDIVKVGITDSNVIVRNAAFFALGQFSEYLQPNITKYAPDILPILFEYLQQLCNELKNGATEPKHINRMFYALETFCENLNDALVPHLPILMERLFQALDPNNSAHVRELALSVVSAAANATKSAMLPYFRQLIDCLTMYLVKTTNEDICALRPQAIDALAALARTIGKENFMPLANDTMNFALTLLEEADDPDLRRSLYNLIAALAKVVNEEMVAVLPKITERLFESVLSTEEVIAEFKNEVILDVPDEPSNDKEIDIEHTDDEDDDYDNIAGYSVENSYLEEKQEAILALKEIAEETGAGFIPYIQPTFENIYRMIDHPQEDIRQASIEALCGIVIVLHKHNDHQGVANAISLLIPKLGRIVHSDEEYDIVIAALEGCADLLKELRQAAVPTEELKDIIFNSVVDVLRGKIACHFDEPSGDEGQEESEYEETVMETAANVLPVFGYALTPEQFALFFGRSYPILIEKLEHARVNNITPQMSCLFGVISECFASLQNYTATYFDTLLPIFLSGITDSSEQTRQNSVFGLGEMVLYADDKSYESYPQILSALSNAVSTEKHQQTLDNICGAIARLIINNCNLVPLDQVLPVFFQHLPLKEDFEENSSVFRCFKVLFIQGKEVVIQYIEQIVAVGLNVLYKKEFKDQDTYDLIIELLKEIRGKFPDKFSGIVNSNPEVANFVHSL